MIDSCLTSTHRSNGNHNWKEPGSLPGVSVVQYGAKTSPRFYPHTSLYTIAGVKKSLSMRAYLPYLQISLWKMMRGILAKELSPVGQTDINAPESV
jgi:hypothetical protein